MNVTCPNCATVFRVDPTKVPEAGVRAQALKKDGTLVDDFLIVEGERSVHVLNAPSPAATACIPIGEAIVERVSNLLKPGSGR